MGTKKTGTGDVVVKGTFAREDDLIRFLETLKQSELGRPHHQTKEMETAYESGAIQITLYLGKHVEFLAKHSLNGGMLNSWKEHCVIIPPYDLATLGR